MSFREYLANRGSLRTKAFAVLPIVLLLLLYILLATIIVTVEAAPPAQTVNVETFDVTISLVGEPQTDAERAPYERIIEYFADGVFESSNGAHRIGTVRIFSNLESANRADILWVENCWPNASPSGRAVDGNRIEMCDTFGTNNFLANDTGWQNGGYGLAHEWGHYFYSLYDEYRGTKTEYDIYNYMPHTTDDAVPNSIMNDQWNATGGHFAWLNFSTALNNTSNTANHRVYVASGWETMARPLSDDPRDSTRINLPPRIYYPALETLLPEAGQAPRIDLPGTARDDLDIIWVGDEISYQIVIDRSGSMDEFDKMENAKTAAKLIVGLAGIDQATIGIIQFDNTVSVLQPLTPIDSQATKDAIISQIDTIQPGNRTAIGDAAKKALDDLIAAGNTGQNNVVFLLTDGLSNEGINPINVIPDYQNASVPLFTFGFGGDADEDVLRRMAQETGGNYYFSPTTLAGITTAFQEANQLVTSSVNLTADAIDIAAGDTSTTSFTVDSTLARLDLVAIYQGGPADLTLTLIDPGSARTSINNCDPAGNATYCVNSIDSPQAGNWQLEAVAGSGRDIRLVFRTGGTQGSTLTYSASATSLTGDVVQYPDPVALVATLSQNHPIAQAGVTANIQRPDGSVESFSMRDDGVAPDAVANDGRYSAILDYQESGLHNITMQFDNNAGNAQLTTEGLAFAIGSDGQSAPKFPPQPVDENFVRSTRLQIMVNGVKADDHGNTPPEATGLPTDNVDMPGKIDYQGDVDVFAINKDMDENIVVRVSDLALDMAPVLRLLGEDGTVVAQDITPETNSSSNGYLQYDLPSTTEQIVYAELSHAQDAGHGFYSISTGAALASEMAVIPERDSKLGLWLLFGGLAGFATILWVRRSGGGGWNVQVAEPGYDTRVVKVGKNGIWVGRNPDCKIRLHDEAVSRRHCWIGPNEKGLFIRDQDSKIGTKRNGRQIKQANLSEQDVVEIGATRLQVRRR